MISGCLRYFLVFLVVTSDGRLLSALRQPRDVKIISKSSLTETKSSTSERIDELTISGSSSDIDAVVNYLSLTFKNLKTPSPATPNSELPESECSRRIDTKRRHGICFHRRLGRQISSEYPSYTRTVCEHATMKLYCLPGQGIRVIDAFYGRNTEEICDDNPNEPAMLNCHSPPNTKAEVEKRCNYRENCAVEASNNLFTDPCLNTVKYLRVTHICVEEPLFIVSACDGDGVRIHCPQGTSIKVNSVTYGKTRHDVCNKPGIRTYTLICQAVPDKTTQIVVDRCDGKPVCSVHTVTDIVSAVGDPCVGILKHFDVKYMCL